MSRFLLLCLAALLLLAAPLSAQDNPKEEGKEAEKKKKEKKPIAKIVDARIGLRPSNPNDMVSRFKVGLWAPVYVTIAAGEKGLPVDGKGPCFLQVETTDSEDVGTIFSLPQIQVEADKTQTFVAYVKTGNLGAEVKVALHVDGRVFQAPISASPLDLHKQIYLSLGARLPDVEKALQLFQPLQFPGDNLGQDPVRYAAFESDYERLPDLWFGYQGVDLIFLTTENKKFLSALANDKNPARLQALAQWVRRGGRLVISANWQNQDLLAALLENRQAWVPPVPVIPPATPGDVKKNGLKDLNPVAEWLQIGRTFHPRGENLIFIPQLKPANLKPGSWEVMAETQDQRPLIARMPYGLGNITLLAFSLDKGEFLTWDDRAEFLKKIISRLAPRPLADLDKNNLGNFGLGRGEGNDLVTDLQRGLDQFDVLMVPFGWVALFIILYILVVGPLDYVILRFVFGKLEWTWFTFPTVVIIVSVAAYYTAFALKGNDLKVNKVDIVDFDLRTDLDAQGNTARAYAYGQTFFTLLSPRVQNYTIGIEPNPVFWGGEAGKPRSADQVSWLGRPNRDEPGGEGRRGAQAFFRRPYRFAEDATGLANVPIPVWTTKSMVANWEAALDQLPFEVKLNFHGLNEDVRISGSLQNNLPVDLEDVWLFHGPHVYPLEGGLPGKNAAKPLEIQLGINHQRDLRQWLQLKKTDRRVDTKTIQDPTTIVKQLMFHQELDVAGNLPNHSQRPFDLSWRLRGGPDGLQAGGDRGEAILVARVAFRHGSLESATADNVNPLPTKLWLGELPNSQKVRPTLQGKLYQDTYIRVLLPVRLANNK